MACRCSLLEDGVTVTKSTGAEHPFFVLEWMMSGCMMLPARASNVTTPGAPHFLLLFRRRHFGPYDRQTKGRDWAKLKSARYFGADFGMDRTPSSSAQDDGQPCLFRAAPAGLAGRAASAFSFAVPCPRITHKAQNVR
ncbi:hypothetical protein V8C26DRAFT_67172 [Trichoderma gracile]